MERKPLNKPKSKLIWIRLTPHEVVRIEKLAQSKGTTWTIEVNFLIRKGMAK